MKLIQCIIRQEKLNAVVDKLAAITPGLTVSEVRGHGRQGGHTVMHRGTEYHLSLLPKVLIEILVDDDKVDVVVEAATEASRTGEIGDGRIYVVAVEQTYHIRTGLAD